MLELHAITAGYDKRAPVLRGASLTVAPGEAVGLLVNRRLDSGPADPQVGRPPAEFTRIGGFVFARPGQSLDDPLTDAQQRVVHLVRVEVDGRVRDVPHQPLVRRPDESRVIVAADVEVVDDVERRGRPRFVAGASQHPVTAQGFHTLHQLVGIGWARDFQGHQRCGDAVLAEVLGLLAAAALADESAVLPGHPHVEVVVVADGRDDLAGRHRDRSRVVELGCPTDHIRAGPRQHIVLAEPEHHAAHPTNNRVGHTDHCTGRVQAVFYIVGVSGAASGD
ncbi:hypothetical protein [Streptomyces sp. SD31]|uniref:hypothetical protein n=1 Tax=Streptomyces sp. SD31 TaxID=3452208 RepID=UPI003F8A9FD6